MVVEKVDNFSTNNEDGEKESNYMEPNITEVLVKTGVELGQLAVKGTATLTNTKIQSMKNERDIGTIRRTYEEIINELLNERDEAIRIAQVYRAEYEKVNIRDEDIAYLHNTLVQVISLLGDFSNFSDNQSNSLRQFADLLNKDTLKTMQLLGFNYKEAIGAPLTEVCANAIKNSLGNGRNNKRK